METFYRTPKGTIVRVSNGMATNMTTNVTQPVNQTALAKWTQVEAPAQQAQPSSSSMAKTAAVRQAQPRQAQPAQTRPAPRQMTVRQAVEFRRENPYYGKTVEQKRALAAENMRDDIANAKRQAYAEWHGGIPKTIGEALGGFTGEFANQALNTWGDYPEGEVPLGRAAAIAGTALSGIGETIGLNKVVKLVPGLSNNVSRGQTLRRFVPRDVRVSGRQADRNLNLAAERMSRADEILAQRSKDLHNPGEYIDIDGHRVFTIDPEKVGNRQLDDFFEYSNAVNELDNSVNAHTEAFRAKQAHIANNPQHYKDAGMNLSVIPPTIGVTAGVRGLTAPIVIYSNDLVNRVPQSVQDATRVNW